MNYKNHEITTNNYGIETIDGLEVFGSGNLELLVKFNKNLAIYKFTIYASRMSCELQRPAVKYTGINRHTGKIHNFGSSIPTKKLLKTYEGFNDGYDYTLPFTIVDENEIHNFKVAQ